MTDHDYVRVDGVRLGHILTSSALGTFLNLSAAGDLVEAFVWTGGVPNVGPAAPEEICGDWIGANGATAGRIGNSNFAGINQFSTGSELCGTRHPVFCLSM